jgi:hypothetical protein
MKCNGSLLSAALLGVALCMAPAQAAKKELDTNIVYRLETMLERENLWETTPENFGFVVRDGGFSWGDAAKTSARGGVNVLVKFQDLRIWEVLVQFESNRMERVDAYFYNRGDVGNLTATEFTALLAKVTGALSNWTGAAAAALPDVDGPARTKIQRAAWKRGPTKLELEWSVTKPHVQNGKRVDYRSEFIRLKALPLAAATNAPAKMVTGRPAPAPGRTAAELKKRVRTEENGDVYIGDVPMVNQGEKGYCAAAVMARVMGYFGLDFDMHQAAQIAGTKSSGGTSGSSMLDALKRISQKNSMRLVGVEDLDLHRLLADYNRAAQTAKKEKVKLERDLGNVFDAMEGELVKQVRTKRQSEVNKFKTDVAKNVDIGIPLIWDVHLGWIPEEFVLPQTKGGHLRMIIGYNKKTDEILYTDSWGPRHALKRMPADNAWTITTGVFVVKPNSL